MHTSDILWSLLLYLLLSYSPTLSLSSSLYSVRVCVVNRGPLLNVSEYEAREGRFVLTDVLDSVPRVDVAPAMHASMHFAWRTPIRHPYFPPECRAVWDVPAY